MDFVWRNDMGRASIAALLLAAATFGVSAQAQPSTAESEAIKHIIVYGTDPCPRGGSDELVVCARRPEAERFRIPEALRETKPTVENESWAEKAEALEMMGRTGIQSCSPVGPGGASGCLNQLIDQARAERRAAQGGKKPTP
jgi:hypothetical protein